MKKIILKEGGLNGSEAPSGFKFLGLDSGGDLSLKTGETVSEIDGGGGGAGLAGTQYIFVAANGTPQENATELQAAYDTLKTMSPSADNRLTLIAAPGEYQFPSTFVMDTEYIDLVSLTGNRDVIFDLEGITDPFIYDTDTFDIISISECILIDADNVYVKGIKGKFYLSPEWDDFYLLGEDYILPIQVGNNLPNIVVENCEGGPFSFGGDITFGSNPIIVSGTFINCKGDNVGCFGGYGIASGIFINCQGGEGSFGSEGTVSGTFTNCQGGDFSFGGFGTASGTFTDCEGANSSFGGVGTASGTFTNCQGGDVSFGGAGTASGTFTDCVGGDRSFGGGGFGTASGTFTDCVGGDRSFGGGFPLTGTNGTLSGKLYYCRLTSGTFGIVEGSGVTVLCIDGNNQINTQN